MRPALSIQRIWPSIDLVTKHIQSLKEIASDYDAIVLDQWGVLHDGSTPYGQAIEILSDLAASKQRLAVLSNSGKRAAPNAARISDMGFAQNLFETVMTSGEALWRDVADNRIDAKRFFPIERDTGDAAKWAEGLDISMTDDLAAADAVLLMGLPDGATLDAWTPVLQRAKDAGLPLYCSNPDRQSPRAGGLVISPGALAYAYKDLGGTVTFYGKPHLPIFESLSKVLKTSRLLMVGDSLEHDICGGHNAGWDTLFVRGGLYAKEFSEAPAIDPTLKTLADAKAAPLPTYSIEVLK